MRALFLTRYVQKLRWVEVCVGWKVLRCVENDRQGGDRDEVS